MTDIRSQGAAPNVGSAGQVAPLQNAIITLTLSPGACAAGVSEVTFSVTGLSVGDWVSVNKPTFQAGLTVPSARVSAANVLAIQFHNGTTASITATASEVYVVHVVRNYNVSTKTKFEG